MTRNTVYTYILYITNNYEIAITTPASKKKQTPFCAARFRVEDMVMAVMKFNEREFLVKDTGPYPSYTRTKNGKKPNDDTKNPRVKGALVAALHRLGVLRRGRSHTHPDRPKNASYSMLADPFMAHMRNCELKNKSVKLAVKEWIDSRLHTLH